jgi:thiol-disulfide isomerase/thioredoxin
MKTISKAGLLFFICMQTLVSAPVKVVNMDTLLQETTAGKNDTLYVVNFWATWCAPCVKELPAFQTMYTKFAPQKVKMIFVSLNSIKDNATVEKFAKQHDLKPEVLLLDAGNPNVWINKVDTTWSGTIPATAMYRMGKKVYFHEGDFTEDQLKNIIQLKLSEK